MSYLSAILGEPSPYQHFHLLHAQHSPQVHKGVFKWVTEVAGEEEIDKPFHIMLGYPGLHHFVNGILFALQWTGHEHKETQQVFIGSLGGSIQPAVLCTAVAGLDFIYLLQLQIHTLKTLEALKNALTIFHGNKDIFIQLGV